MSIPLHLLSTMELLSLLYQQMMVVSSPSGISKMESSCPSLVILTGILEKSLLDALTQPKEDLLLRDLTALARCGTLVMVNALQN